MIAYTEGFFKKYDLKNHISSFNENPFSIEDVLMIRYQKHKIDKNYVMGYVIGKRNENYNINNCFWDYETNSLDVKRSTSYFYKVGDVKNSIEVELNKRPFHLDFVSIENIDDEIDEEYICSDDSEIPNCVTNLKMADENLYDENFFIKKHIYEVETKNGLPFELIWGLNRVQFLMRNKNFKKDDAIDYVNKKMGISKIRLLEGLNSRSCSSRWGKKRYREYLKSIK